jgi:hypothetical protein
MLVRERFLRHVLLPATKDPNSVWWIATTLLLTIPAILLIALA